MQTHSESTTLLLLEVNADLINVIYSPFYEKTDRNRPVARFSKVPITFYRARSYILRSKSTERWRSFSPHISPICLINLEFYKSAFKTNKIRGFNENIARMKYLSGPEKLLGLSRNGLQVGPSQRLDHLPLA